MISSKLKLLLLCLGTFLETPDFAMADGKVFAPPDVRAKVEIPNQQALLAYRDGVECLVIETSFLGEGTNFAWVVPLPAQPTVRPVSPGFFPALQRAFQPRLVHHVRHYYVGILFFLGLAFLGWRALKDEASWVNDLPLCLLLAAGAGLAGKSVFLAGFALVFLIVARLVCRTSISYALVMLVELLLMAWGTAGYGLWRSGLIATMGDSAESPSDVTVLSVQHAGNFDATTIRSEKPAAILDWLANNGFAAPPAIEPVVRDYVARGWVFVASKVRRAENLGNVSVLHPLAFTFSTKTPVYPLKLTGVENGDLTIDLYVFGGQRAAMPHFRAARCDRTVNEAQGRKASPWNSWLRLNDSEVLDAIGNATVGTKLTARLQPSQMTEDAEISWRWFSAKGATVYSRTGAASIALNVGIPLVAMGWLLVGGWCTGWKVDRAFVRRWRVRVFLAACLLAGAIYWWLPKVEVIGPMGFG